MSLTLMLPAIAGSGLRLYAQTAPTIGTLSASGTQTYQLTCTESGPGLAGVAGPTGSVAFVDVTLQQLLGTATLNTQITNYPFETPTLFPAGNLPVSIAPGDFNGDGKEDVAFGGADGSVSVLLSNGDGTFQAPVTTSTPAQLSFSLAAGDFNGDGKLDLAVADWHSDKIYILLGNGDGTFQPPQAIVNSAGPYGEMVAADINGDGKLDLVITDFNSNEVSVLLGKGDGTFQAALTTQTDAYPGGVAAADFNGDGKLDLVVTSPSGVSIFLGKGDGTFGTATDYPVVLGESSDGVTLADFNGDGKTDIAVASIAGIVVLLGNGDGTFQQPSVVSSDAASYIATSDFNGDGKPDLVISGYDPTFLEIFLGNGDGTFTWYESLGDNGDTPGPIATGFFSSPGWTDLLVGNVLSADASIFLTNAAIATATLSGVVLPAQPPPSHYVQCFYGGDSNYTGSTSNQVLLAAESASAPVFTPAGGTYHSTQTVSITDASSGAAIYFTKNGSTPTSQSTPYTAPISITTSETLKAIAYLNGYSASSVVSAAYTLQAATPVIAQASGTNGSTGTVTITDATSGAQIFYTTDGSQPTNLSQRYQSAINVALNGTIKAIAMAAGFLNSEVATYKVVQPDYSVAATPPSQTVTAGQSATYSLTLTPTGGFSQAVVFSCSGLPTESSCVFQPGTLTPAGGAVKTSMSISTTAATTLSRNAMEPRAPWRTGGTLTLAGILGAFFLRRRLRLRTFCCVLILAGTMVFSSCSSANYHNPGTPQGTYKVTVSTAATGFSAKTLQVTMAVN